MSLGTKEKEAISEVLEILNYMEEEYVNKIPSKFLKFLEDNKDEKYKKHIDINLDINTQISKEKTRAILGVIFYNFWCNEDEKIEFTDILRTNEIKKQEKLRDTYKYEDLFKKSIKREQKNKNLPIEIKKKWYERLISILRKVFHIK